MISLNLLIFIGIVVHIVMLVEWLKKQMGNTSIPNTDDIRWLDKEFHTNDIYFIKHLWSCSWDINELPVSLQDNVKLIDFLKNDVRNKNNKFFVRFMIMYFYIIGVAEIGEEV